MAEAPDPPASDDAWILALAADIADGKPVDWAGLTRAVVEPRHRLVIDELRSLAAIATAHRSPAASGEHPGDTTLHETSPAPTEHGTWQHLRLLERVGAGSCGVVYRAWDTRLDREVAVKLLSGGAEWSASGRRPLQEARLLARVRHPHIVSVYDADEGDDGQVGIWMEFIHGETLEQIVRARGTMSAREAAGIGIDLCRALSALHGAGLLHRDIKAQNVMRERGGRIVLMDFSTVRLADAGDVDTVGTPLYMAPELFEGASDSPVTDVYGLGVLIFHLLSGRYPVEASTAPAVREAHQRGERQRLSDLRPAVPSAIEQVVDRAISPDPAARYRTAGELEHALRVASGSGSAASQAITRQTPWWAWAAFAAGVLATIAGTWASRDTAARQAMVHFTLGPPFNSGSWPRLAPDGRRIAFGGPGEAGNVLWVRELNALGMRPLAGTLATETPFWSFDSRALGFFGDGKLKRINADSGDVFTIASAPQGRGGDWHADGTILFAPAIGEPIFRVRPDGSGLTPVTTIREGQGEYQHAWPEFLPDGRRFLFVVRSTDARVSGIYLGSLAGAPARRLLPAYSRAVYSPTGHLVYVRAGVLLAHPFDVRAGRLAGEPEPIVPSTKFHEGGDAAFDLSADGTLIYRPAESLALTRLVMVDRRGRELQVIARDAYHRHPRFSPDGTRLAAERATSEGQQADIWIYDVERGSATRLTTDLAADVRPVWAPDGRSVVFASRRGTTFQVYRHSIDAVGGEHVLFEAEGDLYPEHWSTNGFLTTIMAGEGLWAIPIGGGRRVQVRPRTGGADPGQSVFSPDGRWLAYMSFESGTMEVYVEPFPSTGERWQVSTDGGAEPYWRADGRELFYLALDGTLMSVAVGPGPGFEARRPQPLFKVSVPEIFMPSDYTVSPDGQRFVVNTLLQHPPTPPIHVLLYWPELLAK